MTGGALVESAWAKINLTLQVTGRRADGYHELESLVVFAEVGDVLTFEPAESGNLSLTIDGPQAGPLLSQGENLVRRAAEALSRHAGVTAGAAITLTKNLPVASGIGGGSADAAAALRGLSRLWDITLPQKDLQALALGLGADLPVCLRGEPAVMSGIGEGLEPVAALPPFWLLLVNPGVPVSTAGVFRDLAGSFSRIDQPRQPPQSLTELIDWLAARGNDLEAPARRRAPAIGQVLTALQRQPACLLARMSGSGATCFGMFEEESAARAAADEIARQNRGWWVAPARLRA